MTKIVTILGSPKGPGSSSTGTMVQEFIDHLRMVDPTIQSEVVALGDGRILACRGCMVCQKTGRCVIEDRMATTRDLLRAADLLVFASPVHFNHVSSVFQNFVERSLIDLHTFEYLGKPFVTVVTTNGSGEGEAEKYLARIGLLFGAIKIGSIRKIHADRFDTKRFQTLVRDTTAFLQRKRRARPTLMNRLYFLSMKSIIQGNPSYFPYESRVWSERGWFEKSFGKAYAERRAETLSSS